MSSVSKGTGGRKDPKMRTRASPVPKITARATELFKGRMLQVKFLETMDLDKRMLPPRSPVLLSLLFPYVLLLSLVPLCRISCFQVNLLSYL